jgi:bacterioferritin-associated ferredoxin
VLVCHCRAVSEREIRLAVESGASTSEDVARTCGAGGDCGGCRPSVLRVIEEASVGFELVGD